MASRKRQDGEKPAAKARPARTRAPWPRWRIDRNAVVMGDVRPAPAAVRQEGETYTPDIAVWAQAESGMAWGVFIGPPGQRAQTLVQALFEPRPPPFEPRQTLPRQLILFDDTLAGEVRETLSDSRVEIALSERFESFETMFTALLEQLAAQADPTLHLPDDAIAALCAASARLWRAKPWQFAYDEPAIELKPQRGSAPPLYASILGGNREVLGAALYTVLEDYEHDRELGMTLEESDTDLDTPDVADELDVAEMAAAMAHEAQLHGRVFLVSFDEKEDMEPAYREQLTRNGWPGRLSVVPTFIARGGSGTAEATPNDVTADEARHIALAIEALVTFCERHEDALAAEEFPIRDTVEIKQAGETVKIDVAAPAGEGETSTATVLRFKVSLKNNKRVWRRIDVRSDQTLIDLHGAIQTAFRWDDDHLYAFFLSGKAWDRATEYQCPTPYLEPGQRSARVRVDHLNLRPRQRMLYIFDFGDEWRHDVVLEQAGLPQEPGRYPRIVEEHGTPPPQYPDGDDEDDLLDEDDEDDGGQG